MNDRYYKRSVENNSVMVEAKKETVRTWNAHCEDTIARNKAAIKDALFLAIVSSR